jgi:hypothetical protein
MCLVGPIAGRTCHGRHVYDRGRLETVRERAAATTSVRCVSAFWGLRRLPRNNDIA